MTSTRDEGVTKLKYKLERIQGVIESGGYQKGDHLFDMVREAIGLLKDTDTAGRIIHDLDITREAALAGFMFHTGYGQGSKKQMPVSDTATLIDFARRVLALKDAPPKPEGEVP